MLIIAAFEKLARQHDLLYKRGQSLDGFSEAYLYSHDMQYRYAFARWKGEGSVDLWVGLNPATGDTENRWRPTLNQCLFWSQQSAGIIIVNLFAYRATKPADLFDAAKPANDYNNSELIGEHNDAVLRALTAVAGRTIVAWGGHRQARERASVVSQLLSSSLCLGMTAKGQPRHPLFVKQSTQMQAFGWKPE